MGPTHVIITADSSALPRTRVRLVVQNLEVETDAEGRLEIALGPGTHPIEILWNGEWISSRLDNRHTSSTLVVDIAKSAKSDVAFKETMDFDEATAHRLIGGRYLITAELGRGGMGVVHRAMDQTLKRTVAIKTLGEAVKGIPEARDLFLEEARQLATLSHPNLVAVFDVTTIDDEDMIITEFLEGQNLDELLEANGAFPLEEAISIAIQMTQGIVYLHKRGIIHRDLKPANTILLTDGSIKIIDFGLARSLDHLLAKGTQVRGTPAYMAPEQFLGPGPSSATDIYQLGVTYFEILSKKFPFDIDDRAPWKHVTAPRRSLAQCTSDLPPRLVKLIDGCVNQDPSLRPTAEELLAELTIILREIRGEQVPAPRASDSPPPKGSHAVLGLAIGVGMFMIAALAVAAWMLLDADDDESMPDEPAEIVAVVQEVMDDEAEDDEPEIESERSEAISEARSGVGDGLRVAGLVALQTEPPSRRPSAQPTPVVARPVPKKPVEQAAAPEPEPPTPVKTEEEKAPMAKETPPPEPLPRPERIVLPTLAKPTPDKPEAAEEQVEKKEEEA
ncbi:MAG: serine/threonine protein kinase, partial [Bradymonadaceae bacterium]